MRGCDMRRDDRQYVNTNLIGDGGTEFDPGATAKDKKRKLSKFKRSPLKKPVKEVTENILRDQ